MPCAQVNRKLLKRKLSKHKFAASRYAARTYDALEGALLQRNMDTNKTIQWLYGGVTIALGNNGNTKFHKINCTISRVIILALKSLIKCSRQGSSTHRDVRYRVTRFRHNVQWSKDVRNLLRWRQSKGHAVTDVFGLAGLYSAWIRFTNWENVLLMLCNCNILSKKISWTIQEVIQLLKKIWANNIWRCIGGWEANSGGFCRRSCYQLTGKSSKKFQKITSDATFNVRS